MMTSQLWKYLLPLAVLLAACGRPPDTFDEFDRLRLLPPKTDWDLQQDFNAGRIPTGHYIIRRMVLLPCGDVIRLGGSLFEIGDLVTPAFIFAQCVPPRGWFVALQDGKFAYVGVGLWSPAPFDVTRWDYDPRDPENPRAEAQL